MDLVKASGSKEAVERFQNSVKSDYRKRLESKGWEFVENECFYSMMDEMQPLELVYGEDIILAKNSLRDRMKFQRMYLKKIHSAEKVRFFRGYDTSGNRIPKEILAVGVYIKRRVN